MAKMGKGTQTGVIDVVHELGHSWGDGAKLLLEELITGDSLKRGVWVQLVRVPIHLKTGLGLHDLCQNTREREKEKGERLEENQWHRDQRRHRSRDRPNMNNNKRTKRMKRTKRTTQ